jgi:RNA polymerase sigma-70 factor (ECF subfamily)
MSGFVIVGNSNIGLRYSQQILQTAAERSSEDRRWLIIRNRGRNGGREAQLSQFPQPSQLSQPSQFHRLVEEQIPRLRRYAHTLTRNRQRGDDLVQDTLVRALAREHLWQPGTNLRAWLFTIMHNQNVNLLRSSARDRSAMNVEDLAATLPAPVTADPIARRQLCELEAALGRLLGEQRQVVLLIGLEGMNYAEAAKILNIPIGTVRSRLSRARENLRQMMGISDNKRTRDTVRAGSPSLAAA